MLEQCQCCVLPSLLGSFSARLAVGITSRTGEDKIRPSDLRGSECCIVFNQVHWKKRWIENPTGKLEKKKTEKNKRHPVLSLQWLSSTSQAAGSSCNLWCFCVPVDKKDVDSDAPSFHPTFYLDWYMKADKGGQEEQLIGICWARLTCTQRVFFTSGFHLSAWAAWVFWGKSM